MLGMNKRTQRRSRYRGLFETLENRQLLAVDFGLLADMNSQPSNFSSQPYKFAGVGDYALFVAYSDTHGDELWRTDGTQGGTFLVAETEPGPESGQATFLGRVGSTAYFSSFSQEYGIELYLTDGTVGGSRLVKDIVSGPDSSYPLEIASLSSRVLFWAGGTQYQLWTSDGTSAGTTQVSSISGGFSNSVVLNGYVFFAADDGTNGVELWKSDGTTAGTQLVRDINVGSAGSLIYELSVYNNQIVFGAADSSNNFELWASDGTSAGTRLLKEIVSGTTGSTPNQFVQSSQGIFFKATGGIWLTDATAAGTRLIFAEADLTQINLLTSQGGVVYFSKAGELWQSDGTTTLLVDDGGQNVTKQFTGGITVVGDVLYFSASSASTGNELWKKSQSGVSLVADIVLGSNGAMIDSLFSFSGKLLFSAADDRGSELWISNGTAAGTNLVRDIQNGTKDGAYLMPFSIADDLFFSATVNGIDGLYKTKGSASSIGLIKSISLREYGFYSNGFHYFSASDGVTGTELWRTDGTTSGTTRVTDINPGAQNSFPSQFVEVDSAYYFEAQGVNGQTLWKIDKSTGVVAEVTTTTGSVSQPDMLTRFNNRLIFGAFDPLHGYELWTTDGTASGTQILKDIRSGTNSSIPAELTVLGDKVVFTAESEFGRELWITDGTAGGTVQLKDLYPGAPSSRPRDLVVLGGQVFFSAEDGTSGIELWRTDGTSLGTLMVADMGPGDSRPHELSVLGQSLLFSAHTQSTGIELWKLEGGNITLLKDIRPGVPSSGIANLNVIGNKYYFQANDGVHGPELWVSDGTTTGTFMVDDVSGDAGGGVISDVAMLGPKLVMIVQTLNYGSEIWIERNLPPEIMLSSNGVLENSPPGSVVGILSYIDPNPWDTNTLSLVSGAGGTDNNKFEIVGGQLRTAAAFDYEELSTRSIRVRATDSESNTLDKVFVIQIGNVNESPTNLALSNVTVDENSAVGTVVGVLSTTDPDAGNTFTYSLVAGTGDSDNFKFQIVGNELRANQVIDFETQSTFSIRVRSQDQGGLSVEKSLIVTARDLNESPTNLALSSVTVDENSAVGTVVGVLSTTDPDAGNTFTYSLVAGTGDGDNSKFQIVGNELRANQVIDFETQSTFSIRVRSQDQGGLSVEKSLIVTARDLNESPTNLALSSATVDENSAVGTVVGVLSTTDPDAGSTFTYSLVAGTGDSDNSKFQIVGNELRANQVFDFETQSTFSIRVRSQDQGGLSVEKSLIVTARDLNESPKNLALSSATVDENSALGTVVGVLSTTDPEAGNTFTYSLVAGTGDSDNSKFQIVGNELRANQVFDFETQSTFSIRVRSQDQGGLSVEKSLIVTARDLNESPKNLALSSATVDENSALGTVVGVLSTTDPDAGNTFTYSLVAGTGDGDNSKFQIVGNELRANQVFDFETQSTFSIRVRSQDQGGLSVEKSLIVTARDLNESPTNLALSSATVDENSAIGTVVGVLSTTDPDAGNAFTYSLVAGTGDSDNAKFQIVGNELRTNQAINFEAQASFAIRIRTADGLGGSFSMPLSIAVVDKNEAPTAIRLSSREIREWLPIGTKVGRLTTEDADNGDTHLYTLSDLENSDASSYFAVVGDELFTSAQLDFETQPLFVIRITTRDSGALSYVADFTINVLDHFLREDVTISGQVTPSDALIVINYLNSGQSRITNISNRLLDVNRDGRISPTDALIIINFLNRRSAGEAESDVVTPVDATSADIWYGSLDDDLRINGPKKGCRITTFSFLF